MEKFSISNAQRYYHFIAFKGDISIFSNSFLTKVGFEGNSKYETINSGDIKIKNLKFASNIPFFRGEQNFSSNEDGLPPFKYETIIITISSKKIVMLGFPYKLLTQNVINNLVNEHKICSKGNFLKVNMTNFLKINEHTDYFAENINYFFSSIDLVLTEEETLSVTLEGDKPLDTKLYKNIFLEKIQSDMCTIEKCKLKSKISIGEGEKTKEINSSIHIDKFGNYRLYVHSNGRNILSIPYLFEHFDSLNCLTETPINPVTNLSTEEQ